MSGHELLHAVDLVGRRITVGPDVEHDETDFDTGMHALVLSLTEDDPDVWIMELDFRPFMDHNRPLMMPNYYDKDGQPTLTVEQAGLWKGIDTWYLPAPGQGWGRRLLPRPRWRSAVGGFRIDGKGRRFVSVFDHTDAHAQWKRYSEGDLIDPHRLLDHTPDATPRHAA